MQPYLGWEGDGQVPWYANQLLLLQATLFLHTKKEGTAKHTKVGKFYVPNLTLKWSKMSIYFKLFQSKIEKGDVIGKRKQIEPRSLSKEEF